jgi:hypothetical protein
MEAGTKSPLGTTAADYYSKQKAGRSGSIDLAERLAKITIPSVFPPENWQAGDKLARTNQSVNAAAINSLSSKLMLGAFPPGLPMAKLTPVEHKMKEEIRQDPELYSQVVYALSRKEEQHRARLETTKVRSAYTRSCKLGLVTGNCLIKWVDLDSPTVHNMHQYIVSRSANGDPHTVILEEEIDFAVADEDLQEAAKLHRSSSGLVEKPDNEDPITIYHVQVLVNEDEDGDKKEWHYWQELEGGHKVEGSESFSPRDVPPMYPDWMTPEYGSDWGLPYCSDYEGDLMTIENFGAALLDGGAISAFMLTLVDPEGTTRLQDVQNARNLDVIPGRERDLGAYQPTKGADLSVTANEFEKAQIRIGKAFLSAASIQRSGERVTAEEWRTLTAELEQAMGGMYSDIAQTKQRWFVLRFIHMHEMEDKSIGTLPEGLVNVGVVTGTDSIGQTSEVTRLMSFADKAVRVLGPQVLAQHVNPGDFLKRLAAGESVRIDGLIKDAKQMSQEQEQQQQAMQQQALMDKATGPAVSGGMDMMKAMMEQQQQPEQGSEQQ